MCWRSHRWPPTFEAAVTEALDGATGTSGSAAEEQIRDRLIDVVRADTKPRVEFNGVYGFSVRRPRNLFDSDFTRWSAGSR